MKVFHRQKRRGAIAVLVGVILPVLLLIAAYAINVAQMGLVRAELRVATDSAARAAARELSLTQSTADATNAAIEAASRNTVAGAPLTLEAADIQFGVNTHAAAADMASGSRPWVFTRCVGTGPINALRVSTRMSTGSAAGDVPFLFTPFLTTKKFEPAVTTGAMQIDRDIVLVVDRSGSMCLPVALNDPFYVEFNNIDQQLLLDLGNGLLTDGEYDVLVQAAWDELQPQWFSKWDALSDAVEAFLVALTNTVPEEKVGLVWFDDRVGTAQDLTLDYDSIRTALDGLGPRGNTAIGLGLQQGVTVVYDPLTARTFAEKVVVVMTDGQHNTGVRPDAVATGVVLDKFLVIHSISFGAGADQVLMQTVADIGGGRFWHANGAGDLVDAYHDVAVDIPTVLTN